MATMRLFVVVVALVACGGKEPPPPTPVSNVVIVPDAGPPDARLDDVEVVLATMASFKNDMCKCPDKACADQVQERMTKWATEMAQAAGDRVPPRMSDDAAERMTAIGQEYGECMVKAMTPQTGSGATP